MLPSSPHSPTWESAWGRFCQTWLPVLLHRARSLQWRFGAQASVGDPEDLVQGFLLRCIEKKWLARPGIRHFDGYLSTLFLCYVVGEYRHATRQKRAPRGPIVELPLETVCAAECSPERRLFDQRPIEVAVERAQAILCAENQGQALVIGLLSRDALDAGMRDVLAGALRIDRRGLILLTCRARQAFGHVLRSQLRLVAGSEAAFADLWGRVEGFVLPRSRRSGPTQRICA